MPYGAKNCLNIANECRTLNVLLSQTWQIKVYSYTQTVRILGFVSLKPFEF